MPIDLRDEIRAGILGARQELQDLVRTAVRAELDAHVALSDDQLLTLDQAAERLGLSLGAIRRAASRGTLPVTRIGRRVRVRLRDVLARAESAKGGAS